MPIFDQGYQHWSGRLSSHAWRWLAITRHGVRTGMKSMLLRIVLLLAWTPALALAFVLCLWGLLERKSDLATPFMPVLRVLSPQLIADPHQHRVEVWTVCFDYFMALELRLAMLLILLVGPNLISQDLRFNALPLYLSRPLRRIDYFLGKLGVIAVFLGRMVVLPVVIAYVLGLLVSLDASLVRETLPLLLSAVAYGLVIALSAGLLVLALSSLSRNSRYVALLWLGMWFVSSVLGTILQAVEHEQRRHAYFHTIARQNMQLQAEDDDNDNRWARQRAWQRAQEKAWQDFQTAELESAKTDWRPMVAYTTNLSRVGRQMLGTDRSWQSLSLLLPPAARPQFLFMNLGPQYPWYWSAAVLAGLFGFSAWVLSSKVKSLDRLK